MRDETAVCFDLDGDCFFSIYFFKQNKRQQATTINLYEISMLNLFNWSIHKNLSGVETVTLEKIIPWKISKNPIALTCGMGGREKMRAAQLKIYEIFVIKYLKLKMKNK